MEIDKSKALRGLSLVTFDLHEENIMTISKAKTVYSGDAVRVNPYQFIDGEFVRDPNDWHGKAPDGWSVETSGLLSSGVRCWQVEADFPNKRDALRAAKGLPVLTVSWCGPGNDNDGPGWLLFVVRSQFDMQGNAQGYADWLEWGGECSEVTLHDAYRAMVKEFGPIVCDDAALEQGNAE